MSTGLPNPILNIESSCDVQNSSFSDEGAILLDNQVSSPEAGEQNMASPSVNNEVSKNKMRDGHSIVDMIMVYEIPDPSTLNDEDEIKEEDKKNKIREFYIAGLKAKGLLIEIDQLKIKKNAEVCCQVNIEISLIA